MAHRRSLVALLLAALLTFCPIGWAASERLERPPFMHLGQEIGREAILVPVEDGGLMMLERVEYENDTVAAFDGERMTAYDTAFSQPCAPFWMDMATSTGSPRGYILRVKPWGPPDWQLVPSRSITCKEA